MWWSDGDFILAVSASDSDFPIYGRDGAVRSSPTTVGQKGKIPVFLNTDRKFDGLRACSYTLQASPQTSHLVMDRPPDCRMNL